jgi:hypothetical protein
MRQHVIQMGPARRVISDVEGSLAQRVPNCLPGHHQVENAQDCEHSCDKCKGVGIASGKVCEQAENAGRAADRNDIETDCDRQAPPSATAICCGGRLCRRHPSRRYDPHKHHNNDYCRSQAIGFEPAQQSLQGRTYKKSEAHESHDPKSACRQYPSHELAQVQTHRASDQRGVYTEPRQQSGRGNLKW